MIEKEAFLSSIQDQEIRNAIQDDYDLVICETCGAQSDVQNPKELQQRDECFICLDPRQAVPESGQKWTKISNWLTNSSRLQCNLVPQDNFDPGLFRVMAKDYTNMVGIGQTPWLILTEKGIVIWDCSAYFTVDLFNSIKQLSSLYQVPIVAIAISHPHFYTTSLTWAKALQTKLYISNLDKRWYQRDHDSKHINFFKSSQIEIIPGITMIRCGGHFDGSCVLHWDRKIAKCPKGLGTGKKETGVIFCSDTFAPASDRKQITFMWSYPNFIPLPPKDIVQIWKSVQQFEFDDILGAWPGKYIYGDARQKVLKSAKNFVRMEGHDENSFDWGK